MANKTEGSIKLSDRVDVYATSKCQHWKEGDKIRLHPVQAAAWVKAGKATKTPPKAPKSDNKDI